MTRAFADRATESTQGERELLFDIVSSIAIELDAEGRVVRWNRSAARTFGIESAEANGVRLVDLGLELRSTALEEALACGAWRESPRRFDDVAFRSRAGRSGLLGLTFHPIVSSGATGDGGAIVFGKDITEQRLADYRNVHAQRVATIGELAATLAHELNTPAQYLSSNLSFLDDAIDEIEHFARRLRNPAKVAGSSGGDAGPRERDQPETDLAELCREMRSAVSECREGGEKVAALVAGLRELFSAPDASPADVDRVVRSVLEATRARWSGLFDVEYRNATPRATAACREADLREALLPLVLDACSALDAHRRARPGTPARMRVETRLESEALHLAVASDENAEISGPTPGYAVARTIVEAALGGTLLTGPTPDGLFEVRIVLPAPSDAGRAPATSESQAGAERRNGLEEDGP